MKKAIEFLMWAFLTIFVCGGCVTLCGVGEFCKPLLLVGGTMTIGGFMLALACFVLGDRITSKER